MEINIGEARSSITAMDGDQLLSPHLLDRIVSRVMVAIDERNAHRKQVESERRTMAGMDDWEKGDIG